MGISPRQFDQMRTRLANPRSQPEPLVPVAGLRPRSNAATSAEIVLGIDPSLRGTGWGIIRVEGGNRRPLGFGTLRCPSSLPRTLCLVQIAAGLREAIRQHAPTVCAIEGLFFAQNLQTALVMGEARGVCLLAAAEAGLEICEIAPRRVKQAIVGFGGARKSAVALMVQRLLQLAETPAADAADALAIALAHAQDVERPWAVSKRRL